MSVDELADVRSRLAEVDARLGGAGAAAAERHEAEMAELEARFNERGEALARARAAATGLRSLTSPDAMLARAPAVLCAGTRFERALLSTVASSAMVPTAVHVGAGPEREAALLAELQAEPLRLEHRLIETEVLRRRRATLASAVTAPRVSARLVSLMGWTSYVAAPLLAGATVVGILHADRGVGGTLDEVDREVLWEFASTLSQAYESAGLRRALRREREELRRFLEWINARSLALADGPIGLAAETAGRIPPTVGENSTRSVRTGMTASCSRAS